MSFVNIYQFVCASFPFCFDAGVLDLIVFTRSLPFYLVRFSFYSYIYDFNRSVSCREGCAVYPTISVRVFFLRVGKKFLRN